MQFRAVSQISSVTVKNECYPYNMSNYIRQIVRLWSITLLLLALPNQILANEKIVQKIIYDKIASMTLEEKVGQLFIVGFPHQKMSKDLEEFIKNYKPGSYLLFKRNIASIEQIKTLNETLYRLSFIHTRLPPLLAIDQEGGSVSRLPIYPAPPSALAIGQTQSTVLAESMGLETGIFLRQVGFNMNLAPVLDIADPFSNSFIGVRSYGSDPQVVAELGLAYSKGLLRSHVIPTAKHFPGTGGLAEDPHLKVVTNNVSFQSLKDKDLKPFASYATLGSPIAVMLSHFIYPALDESGEPASFSKKIATDLLRRELSFKGLVITDDLQMEGSRQLLRPEVAALRALLAGADIVMLTWSFADQSKAFTYVKNAILKGDLKISEVDEKIRRILTAKAYANTFRGTLQENRAIGQNLLSSSNYRKTEDGILDYNLKANIQSQPSPNQKPPSALQTLCVLSPNKSFISEFSKRSHYSLQSKILAKSDKKENVQKWLKNRNCRVTLLAVTGKTTASLANSLTSAEKKKLIVVNLTAPNLFKETSEFLKVMNLYFNHDNAGKKIAQNLSEILRELNFQIALK